MKVIIRLFVCVGWVCSGVMGAVQGQEAPQPRPWIYRKGQTKIMPLGDSITNAPGWRLDLQRMLRKSGYTFRTVGGRNEPCVEGLVGYHSGFGGWTIGQLPVSESFGGGDAAWKELQPDLILLHIGTNDIQWGQAREAPAALEQLLDRIWKDCPQAGILVAQIIPMAPNSRMNDRGDLIAPAVASFNASIPAIVRRKVSEGKKAAVVNAYDGFDPSVHLADKCHPNAAGHQMMAEAFLKAITSLTVQGVEHPEHNLPPVLTARVNKAYLATVPEGGKVTLEATIEDDDGKPGPAKISWSQAGGPGSVQIETPTGLRSEARLLGVGTHILACTAGDGELESTAYVRVLVTKGSENSRLVDQPPSASGRVISLALGKGPNGNDPAGAVPRGHWNHLSIPKSLPQKLSMLVDDAGKPTTTSYAIEGNNYCAAWDDKLADTPDGRILAGGYVSTNGVNHYLRGIPFKHYDLHFYFYHAPGDGSASGEFVHKILLRDANSDQLIAGPFYAKNPVAPPKGWIDASTEWVEDLKEKTPEANHLVIPGLTLTELNVYTGGPGESWSSRGGTHSRVCALQLVETNP